MIIYTRIIALLVMAATVSVAEVNTSKSPNLVFVFADQWRAAATGYAGDPNLKGKTPNLDKLAESGVWMRTAVSTIPVCSPYRASLLTGQYALSHGLFITDAPLNPELNTIGKVYKAAGYDTGYVGKWHVDGHGRSSFIPPERQHGFDYWKVLECSHSYNKSPYYEGDSPQMKKWKGYDAAAQTRDVQSYITEHANGPKPFAVFLSWGPPHGPYRLAPKKYQKLFRPEAIQLRPNVPAEMAKTARMDLVGYYAHIIALDEYVGDLLKTIDEAGIADNTIFVFTSDHGDMLGSHDSKAKQKPQDESCLVPFLVRYPAGLGREGRQIDMPFGTPDIMPTLLGLCDLEIPESVEGTDYSQVLAGEAKPENEAALIECITPHGNWNRRYGGKEYRGIRTRRYTYVRDLDGPWLLFDNENDPYQMKNLVSSPEHQSLQERLDKVLADKLRDRKDEFLRGDEYIKQWGHKVNKLGNISHAK
jgi:arylsulfatase A-like enzyme